MRLPDQEAILRRYDPLRGDHVIMDEGIGRYRLRSGAVALRKGEDGVSVYRERLLKCQGLPNSAITVAGYSGIARAEVGQIRAMAEPLDVVSDPWPHGRGPMPNPDIAHALVAPPPGLNRSATRRALDGLARAFGEVSATARTRGEH